MMIDFVQDYGCLGPAQRQHLASTPHIIELAARIVDNVHMYPGSVSQQFVEMQSPLLLLAMLFTS